MTKLDLTLKLMPQWTKPGCSCGTDWEDRCPGPCYDLCGCRHCWRGWSKLSLYQRVKLRLGYILRGGDK